MSIQTELTRLTNAKAAIKAAIEGKGVTVPDGTLLDGMASLIEEIKAGGNIRIEQGSVTFAENTTAYTFVSDRPDIFIAYIEDDTDPVYNSSNYVWAFIQDTRLFNYYNKQHPTMFVFGYNIGTRKYYTPSKCSYNFIGSFTDAIYNSILGAKTYKYYAIYGVTAT
jgi:hypothetical protein